MERLEGAGWDGNLGPVIGYIGGFRLPDGRIRRAVWLVSERDHEPLIFDGGAA